MKVTLIITDTADGKAEMQVHFDPPLKRNEPLTTAGRLAYEILKLKGTVFKCKEVEYHTGDQAMVEHEPEARHD